MYVVLKVKGVFKYGVLMEEIYMRNYNFKRKALMKEQKNRKYLYSTGYWPTMPMKKIGENDHEYFIEGSKDNYKKHLKRRANKAIRRAPLEAVGSGAHYKKIFNLPNEWY